MLSFASKGWHRNLELYHPDADIHLIQQMFMNKTKYTVCDS